MSGQNLQNYFIENNNANNTTGTGQGSNQIVGSGMQFNGQAGALSSKNLPRKKRINV